MVGWLVACLNVSRDSLQLVTTLIKNTFLYVISSPFPNRLWGHSLGVIRLSCNANQSSRCRIEVKNAGISDPLMKIAVTDQNSKRQLFQLWARVC